MSSRKGDSPLDGSPLEKILHGTRAALFPKEEAVVEGNEKLHSHGSQPMERQNDRVSGHIPLSSSKKRPAREMVQRNS